MTEDSKVYQSVELVALQLLTILSIDPDWETIVRRVTQAIEQITSVESCFLFVRTNNVLMTERDGQNLTLEIK